MMLNFRQIDNKFCLSGGWTDVPEDAKWLKLNSIRAILDLQFLPNDNPAWMDKAVQFIKDHMSDQGIEYYTIPMEDGSNLNLEGVFDRGYQILDVWNNKYIKATDRVLIKCGVGVSRSPAMLMNYLCTRDNLTYTEAKVKLQKVDSINYGGLPISIDPTFEWFLRNKFPDLSSAFGVRE